MKYGPQLNSYAVVHFFSKHEAEIAISYMNKGYIDGSQIIVQLELPKKKSRSPPHQKGRDHRQRKKYVKNYDKVVKIKRLQKKQKKYKKT